MLQMLKWVFANFVVQLKVFFSGNKFVHGHSFFIGFTIDFFILKKKTIADGR